MDGAAVVEQRRHLPGRRKAAEIVIVDRLGEGLDAILERDAEPLHQHPRAQRPARIIAVGGDQFVHGSVSRRSEEHTSELQSLMRISYAAFCSKKKIHIITSISNYDPNNLLLHSLQNHTIPYQS